MLLPLVASVSVSISVLLIFVGLTLRPPSAVRQRMELYGSAAPVTVEQLELEQSFGQRVLRPLTLRLLRLLAKILPNKRIQQLDLRLQMAGNPGQLSTADFIGIKGWLAITMGLLAALYLWTRSDVSLVMVSVAFGWMAMGFRLPDVWLSRRIKQRQQALVDALPDAIDMLTIAVEAGLSFDQGIGEIVARWNHELSQEFRRVLYEIGVGKSRREALEQLNARTQVPDILSFVIAINHAEELGTSLSRVLSVQSEEMRNRRRQRAQEKANKLPVKMLFPLVMLIFPALFIIVLGPSVPRIARVLIPLMHRGTP